MAYTEIDNPTDYFNTVLYTGNAGTQAITGVGFAPNWVWGKARNATEGHSLHDTVRGTGKNILANTAAAEESIASITAFGSDGFTLGSNAHMNNNNSPTVAWCWKAGTTISSTSTSGSGTAKTYTGSVNTDAGFSIIRYVGNATAGHTIPHHLGKKPDVILVKHLGDGQQWATQWSPLGATKVMRWATSNAISDSNTRWNDTEPTSSVFTLGTEVEGNTNNGNHIAYCFTNIKGYSKIGSYQGNANADGAFVYTGFKPSWIMLKVTNANSQDWFVLDNLRSPFNLVDDSLAPNVADAEATSEANLDFLSNGFKLRMTSVRVNGANNYIYMAFAENPFTSSTGIPTTAR